MEDRIDIHNGQRCPDGLQDIIRVEEEEEQELSSPASGGAEASSEACDAGVAGPDAEPRESLSGEAEGVGDEPEEGDGEAAGAGREDVNGDENADPEASAVMDGGDQFSMFELPRENAEQFKLSTLHICNWGSLDGIHAVKINETGTLITGENGAGKSTVVDALMSLLISPGKNNYNIAAAQGDKSDRNLVSYIRGNYGNDTEDGDVKYSKCLRSDTTVSVLEAVYVSTLTGEKVVLFALFYLAGQSKVMADVKRLYAVAEEEMQIRDILDQFTYADMRQLKNFLKQYKGIRICDDNFSEYLTCYKHRLRIENVNAPALLSRALGLKKIDNLTNLIRNLVLEPGTIGEDVDAAIKQFDDLNVTHDRLLDAREQQKTLTPLVTLTEKRVTVNGELEQFEAAAGCVEPFVADYAVSHFQEVLSQSDQLIREHTDVKARVEILKETSQKNYDSYYLQYMNMGGSAIAKLEESLKNAEKRSSEVEKKLETYNVMATSLGLGEVRTEDDFRRNLEKCGQLEEKLAQQDEDSVTSLADIRGEQRQREERKRELEDELTELKRHPDSNMDIRFLRLRNDISQALDIPAERMVFTAELMEVKRQENSWRGAIERALGGIRQTLLVDRRDYRSITAWLNARHTGLHVKVQVVEDPNITADSFRPRGFLVKLNWKAHPFTEWLKFYLMKSDLTCVSSVEELNNTEYSMTREGLIHKKTGFFEKKDQHRIDDAHDWQLGFSARERIEMLSEDLEDLVVQLKALKAAEERYRNQRRDLDNSRRALDTFRAFDSYADIDLSLALEEVDRFRHQLEEMNSNPDAARCKRLYEEAKAELDALVQQLNNAEVSLKLEQEHNAAIRSKLEAFLQKRREIDPEIRALLLKRCETARLPPERIFEEDNLEKLRRSVDFKRDETKGEISRLNAEMVKIISSFLSNGAWAAIASEWGCDSRAETVDLYLRHLDRINTEGLPALVEDFKKKLTVETSQSVAQIVTNIDHEIHDIKERIDKINAVLQKAEFKPRSFLKIDAAEVRNSETIRKFNRCVKNILSMVDSDDYEGRFKRLKDVMDILQNAVNLNKQFENRQLLDPRLRMDFKAFEVERESGRILDVLESSSGKSGGEKEAFAGAVMAASLAYVLTPAGASVPSYSSIFLDEAFSNTSDKVSERVLRIFQELKLHVNLLTPFKNIDIVRNYAESIVILTKDERTKKSSISYMTWEDYELRRRRTQRARDLQMAKEAGIEVVENDPAL